MAGAPTTLFISPQYLRENTIINDNVDEKVLQPIIRMTQYKDIQQTIGTPLYNKLLSDIDASLPVIVTPAVGTPGNPGYVPPVYGPGTPIPADYKTLLDEYILPVMEAYCILRSIPAMNYKFRQKGISRQNSENSTSADTSELMYLTDNFSNDAEFYAQRLSNYLCTNSTLYPEYHSNSQDLSPNSRNYFGGIHIPRRSRCNFQDRFGRYNGGYYF